MPSSGPCRTVVERDPRPGPARHARPFCAFALPSRYAMQRRAASMANLVDGNGLVHTSALLSSVLTRSRAISFDAIFSWSHRNRVATWRTRPRPRRLARPRAAELSLATTTRAGTRQSSSKLRMPRPAAAPCTAA
eukprot:5905667-Lingulodinium_polyedra.AAC.1